MNLAAYYPVLLFLLVGTGLGIALVSIGKLLGPSKPDVEKNAPYECGFEAFEDARMKFDVRYYLVAILFIIFDLETAFLFPWGVALRDIGWPGFVAMMIFLLEFLLGFAYIWKKGGLDWELWINRRFAWAATLRRPSGVERNEYRRGHEGRVCHHHG